MCVCVCVQAQALAVRALHRAQSHCVADLHVSHLACRLRPAAATINCDCGLAIFELLSEAATDILWIINT